MVTEIRIPTLNDQPQDFDILFKLLQYVNNGNRSSYTLNFTDCFFLRPNAVAFLGGLIRLLNSQGLKMDIAWVTVRKEVMITLVQNGFAQAFGYHSSRVQTGHAIPYREDQHEDSDEIMTYLIDHWIGKGWVHVSPRLCAAIAGKLWEIYTNSFEHSHSPVGVFTCGQHFKIKNELVLSVVDFGVGIPHNVKNYLNKDPRAQTLPSDACLKWACTSGNTTDASGIPRGLGLSLLQEFVKLNNGKLELYSSDGYVKMDCHGEQYGIHSSSFNGTILHLTLICDEKYYHFKDEV